ncbi:MAG: MCP four helix bundle domain-containing protein [Candidatus Saccharibacteria bacterium]
MRKPLITILIGCVFWILIFVLGLTGYLGFQYINQLEVQNTMLYEESMVPLTSIDQAEILYLDQQLELRDMLLTQDYVAHKKSIDFIRAMDRNIEQDLTRYKMTIHRAEEKDKFQTLTEKLGKDQASREQIIKLLQANQNQQAMRMFVDYQTQVSHNQWAFDELQEFKAIQVRNNVDDTQMTSQSHRHFLMLITLAGVLLGLLAGAVLVWFLILGERPVNRKPQTSFKSPTGLK